MHVSSGLPGALLLALALLAAPAGARRPHCPELPALSSLYAEPGNHCATLKEALECRLGSRRRRAVAAPLWLLGGGAARPAHALLRAVLMQGLALPSAAVQLRADAPQELCAILNFTSAFYKKWINKGRIDAFPLSVAATWTGESCLAPGQRAKDIHQGLGGNYFAAQGGAAPVTRRLLARHAGAAAAAACSSWPQLRGAPCGFLAPRGERVAGELTDLPSGWPSDCTCSSNATACITVLVAVEKDSEHSAVQLARSVCAGAAALSPAPPLRPAALADAALRTALYNHSRSFLFLDYDWWSDVAPGERVAPAPPLPDAAPLAPAVPVLVAPAKLMKDHMPHVLAALAEFQPADATLRRLLRNELTIEPDEAACEAAARALPDFEGWLDGPEDVIYLYVQPCDASPPGFTDEVREIIADYLDGTHTNVTLYFDNTTTVQCEDVERLAAAFDDMTKLWTLSQVAGAVVMGAAGERLLSSAAVNGIPLLLAASPESARDLPAGACGVSPDGARLLAALRWMLRYCGWQRVAVLRDESHAAKWQNFSKSGPEELVVHEEVLGAAGADAALAALRALDARVVVLDAGAAAAARALAAAAAAGMLPARGYAWLVLRGAGAGADWPPPAGFEYVTLSGGWRGGAEAGASGAGRLRAAAERRLGARWPPLAAPLLDALLMVLSGIKHFLATDPTFLNMHEEKDGIRFLNRLRNTSTAGVAQEQSCGAEPLVFVHRWAGEGPGRLMAVWPPSAAPATPVAPALYPRMRDAAPCHTTRSGDRFAPVCHDVAWAVALAALLLAPPALWAAAAARRRRLRRRDRAVEARLLGRSALAAAALREHSVPRAALELLDELGAGHYGSVRLAVLREPHRAPLAVAAKAPRADAAAEAESELLREAALLAALRHDHVVRFAGVCFEGAPLVLMEHAFHGDLRRYLRARRPALERARAGEVEPEAGHVGAAALTRLAREAAAALGYLAQQRLVHRDVRAANCLVDARRSLKLADFGLARRLDGQDAGAAGAGEYLCRRRALFPVLWMAPESLARGVFSAASDVWALGVLVLELATLGARPFGAWAAPRVLRHVREGGTPPLPRDAAASTRGVVATCWRRAAAERPSAAQLVAWLAAHPRALRPALAPLEGDAGAPHDPEPNLYLEEWTE